MLIDGVPLNNQPTEAEAEVVRHAGERVGGRALLAGGQRGEQARVARREPGVPRARHQGEPESLPRVVHEREAPVTRSEERERAHQRCAGADPVDHAPGERAADDPDPEQAGDDQTGDPQAEVAHAVQVDDEERDHDPVAERVRDTAGLDQPDGSGQLGIQAADVRDDGIHARA